MTLYNVLAQETDFLLFLYKEMKKERKELKERKRKEEEKHYSSTHLTSLFNFSEFYSSNCLYNKQTSKKFNSLFLQMIRLLDLLHIYTHPQT